VNGARTARYAVVVEDGVVTYADKEVGGDIVVGLSAFFFFFFLFQVSSSRCWLIWLGVKRLRAWRRFWRSCSWRPLLPLLHGCVETVAFCSTKLFHADRKLKPDIHLHPLH
jgi:hypothetical protein